MVELRKRPAPPPAPPPAKKRSTPKPKAEKKETPKPTTSAAPKEAVKEVAKAKPKKMETTPTNGPKKGETITLENFGGEIETNDEVKTTLKKLVEESQSGVVLFTYPKASTPGCTTQACLFRDSYTPLTSTGLAIYGLSNDSPKANTTFKTKQSLPYPLLCDPQQTLISAIGLKKSPSGTTRGVFVVNKEGKVLAAEAGGPAATVDVVKGLVETMGGGAGPQAENKRLADVAAEVADTAAGMDRSGRATPVTS